MERAGGRSSGVATSGPRSSTGARSTASRSGLGVSVSNREHTKGATVGKIVALDPHDDTGLTAQVKIVESPAARGGHVVGQSRYDLGLDRLQSEQAERCPARQGAKRRDVFGAFLDHLYASRSDWDEHRYSPFVQVRTA